MYIIALLILICLMAYLLVHKKNSFAYVIFASIISILIMTFSASIYLNRFYSYTNMTHFDFYIRSKFLPYNMSNSAVLILFNIGMLGFMLANFVGSGICSRKKVYQNVLLSIPAILYLFLESKNVGLFVYIKNSSEGNFMMLYTIAVSAIIFFYIIHQVVSLFRAYFRTRLSRRKKNHLAALISVIIIDIYAVWAFLIDDARRLMFRNANFSTIESVPISDTVLLAVLFVVTLAVIAITSFFQPNKSLIITLKKYNDQEQNMFDDNLSMVMHIYKNAFLGIKKYIELNELSPNIEYIRNNESEIYKICDKTLDNMQNTLTHLESGSRMNEFVNIGDVIKEAINKAYILPEIEVILKENSLASVYINRNKLLEVIVNLLNNASEAISKEKKTGVIEIETGVEDNIAYILVSDNVGVLNKKDIKNIFKMFYTTKPRNKNSGIGLYYSRKIIEHYGGDISVNVVSGSKTSFQIILPLGKK